MTAVDMAAGLSVVVLVGAGLVLLVVAVIDWLIGSPVIELEQRSIKTHFELVRALHDLDVLTDDAHARLRAAGRTR